MHAVVKALRDAQNKNSIMKDGIIAYEKRLADERRQGDWMITYTEKRFWPTDPRPGDFDIRDIAHSLSYANRFAGHTMWPYSVAQHLVLCSRHGEDTYNDDFVTEKMQLPDLRGFLFACLMHDLSEAYIQDIVRPAKRFVQGYVECEDRIMEAAAEQFGFTYPLHPLVKLVDNKMLVTEASQILGHVNIRWWEDDKWPSRFEGCAVEPWLPAYAEHAFLKAYDELRPTLN